MAVSLFQNGERESVLSQDLGLLSGGLSSRKRTESQACLPHSLSGMVLLVLACVSAGLSLMWLQCHRGMASGWKDTACHLEVTGF